LHQQKEPFLHDLSYYFRQELDLNEMNKAAQLLTTFKDFESFSKTGSDVHHFLCDVSFAKWTETNKQLTFEIGANRFLRNMVRSIVGTLLDVGVGKLKASDVAQIVESKKRSNAGFSVPAHGLYLTKVEYPKEIFV